MNRKGWLLVPLLALVWANARLPMVVPQDNPTTPAKVELGRNLFFDPRLSADGKVACASCHKPQFAFSDAGQPVSRGVEGQLGLRNAPTLTNVGYRKGLFWEGRSPKLELQAVGPLTAHDEMAITPQELANRLEAIPYYRQTFRQVFGEAPSLKLTAYALSAFQRTLLSNNSAFDRFSAGDDNALSPEALRGLELFFDERGDCFHCHVGPDFTDDVPRNTGLYLVYTDPGLARATNQTNDVGKFKTPTLRNVALTAPYMHDGSFATLRQVVEHYNSGGKKHPNADALMRPLNLTNQDIDDLVAFLQSLTDPSFVSNPALQAPERQP